MTNNSKNLIKWHEAIDTLANAWVIDKVSEKPSDETLVALSASKILRILDQSDHMHLIGQVVDVCRELGKVDASLGWLVGVANSAWLMRANFALPDATCIDMRNNPMLAMVLGRPGVLQPTSTGKAWLLNGEWKYASGYPYSSYFFCLAAADKGDVRVVLVPSCQLEVVSDWQSIGLLGTRSVTVCARNIEISKEFSISYVPVLTGTIQSHSVVHPYSRYFTSVLMNCLPATLLGATDKALEYVLSSFNRPISGSTYRAMSDSGAARYEIGRLHSDFDLLLRAAEYNAAIIDNAAQQGNTLTSEQRVAIRGRATKIMRGCVEVVQGLLWLYGSSALEKICPLEKIWRDVNVGARHGGFAKLISEELAGIAALKGEPTALTRMF